MPNPSYTILRPILRHRHRQSESDQGDWRRGNDDIGCTWPLSTPSSMFRRRGYDQAESITTYSEVSRDRLDFDVGSLLPSRQSIASQLLKFLACLLDMRSMKMV